MKVKHFSQSPIAFALQDFLFYNSFFNKILLIHFLEF